MATRGLVVAPPRAGVTELVGRINAIPQPTLRGKPRKPPRGARVVADDRLIAEDQPRAAEGSPPWLHDLPEPGSPLIEFALAYARAGLEIMPRRPGAGGRLIDALPGTPRTGLVGEAEVAAYWRARPATPALAVVCGPTSNVLVVDVDQHPGQADGLVTLRELERRHRPLPAPPMVLSPTGAGRHVYFAWPAAPVRFGRLAPGIECVACATRPPSRKRAGRYRWSLSRHPSWLPLPPVPAWLLALMKSPPPPPPRPARRDELKAPDRCVTVALERELAAVARATEGDRNNRLWSAAWSLSRLVGRGLSERELELVAAGARVDLAEREAKAALKSAMRRRNA
jgi:hypothetical protein